VGTVAVKVSIDVAERYLNVAEVAVAVSLKSNPLTVTLGETTACDAVYVTGVIGRTVTVNVSATESEVEYEMEVAVS
jgi:hypothetical protein